LHTFVTSLAELLGGGEKTKGGPPKSWALLIGRRSVTKGEKREATQHVSVRSPLESVVEKERSERFRVIERNLFFLGKWGGEVARKGGRKKQRPGSWGESKRFKECLPLQPGSTRRQEFVPLNYAGKVSGANA